MTQRIHPTTVVAHVSWVSLEMEHTATILMSVIWPNHVILECAASTLPPVFVVTRVLLVSLEVKDSKDKGWNLREGTDKGAMMWTNVMMEEMEDVWITLGVSTRKDPSTVESVVQDSTEIKHLDVITDQASALMVHSVMKMPNVFDSLVLTIMSAR